MDENVDMNDIDSVLMGLWVSVVTHFVRLKRR